MTGLQSITSGSPAFLGDHRRMVHELDHQVDVNPLNGLDETEHAATTSTFLDSHGE